MQRNFGKIVRGHRPMQPVEPDTHEPKGPDLCVGQAGLGHGAGDTVLHLGPPPANGGDGVRVNAEDSGEQSEGRLLPSEVALADYRPVIVGQATNPLPAHATFSEGLGV